MCITSDKAKVLKRVNLLGMVRFLLCHKIWPFLIAAMFQKVLSFNHHGAEVSVI